MDDLTARPAVTSAFLTGLVALALCAVPAPAAVAGPLGAVAVDGAPGDTVESGGAFVMHHADRVVGIDVFEQVGDTLRGRTDSGENQSRYEAILRPDQTLSHLVIHRYLDGSEEADGTIRVEFRGDTAVARMTQGGESRTRRVATPEPVVPVGWHDDVSVVDFQQVIRRARHLGGDSVAVPILGLRRGETMQASVVFPTPDSARVSVQGFAMHLALDGSRVLGGETMAGNWRFERVTPAKADEALKNR